MQVTTSFSTISTIALALTAVAALPQAVTRGAKGATCTQHSDCSPQTRCLNNGQNKYVCSDPVPSGKYCADPAKAAISVCAENLKCSDSKCIDITPHTRGLGLECLKDECQPSLRCLRDNFSGKYTCRGPIQAGGYCTVSSVCQDGYKCSQNKCVLITPSIKARQITGGAIGQTCTSHSQCDSRYRCLNNGRNQYVCSEPVKFGQFCSEPGKPSISVCARNLKCSDNKCIDATPNTRGLGQLCVRDECRTELRCLRDNFSGTYTCRGPIQEGGFCTVSSVCQDGYHCNGNKCTKTKWSA